MNFEFTPASRSMIRWIARVAFLSLLMFGEAHAALEPATDDPQMKEAWDLYQVGNTRGAAKAYLLAAKRGQPIAEFNYGVMLLDGEGVRINVREGHRWVMKSAKDGFAAAQYAVGLLYEYGDGVPKSALTAAHWFRLAAEQDHADAEVGLATLYFTGRGVAQDYHEAAKWYLAAANNDVEEAQYIIASCYEHGDGVEQDLDVAIYWYQRAAIQGDLAAAAKVKAILAELKKDRAT